MVSFVERTFHEEMESSMIYSTKFDTEIVVYPPRGRGKGKGYHRIVIGEFGIIRRDGTHFDTESLSLNIDRCGSHFFLFPFKTLGKQSGETERTERFIRRSAASIPGTEYYSGDSRNRCANGMEAATLEGRTPFFSLLYPDPKLPIESKSPVPLFENTEKSSSPLCIIHTQGGRTKSRANT